MKKLLGIVVLGLLWCNVGFAEEINCNTLNECLKKNYTIKNKITFKPAESFFNIIYELEKKRAKILIHCIVNYRLRGGRTFFLGSQCYKP